MDKALFIKKTPYLYHLTDQRNLEHILAQRELLSTACLVNASDVHDKEAFLTTKRTRDSRNVAIRVDGKDIFIRDQHPINNALVKALPDNWTAGDFLMILNSRVFFWPKMKRLENHYAAYSEDKPIILRIATEDLLSINDHVKVSFINSGDTRCIAHYRAPAPRGPNTFLPLESIPHNRIGTVAEVTFEDRCLLPECIYLGKSPNGKFTALK